MNDKGRPTKEFWAESDLSVVRSTGYQCGPVNPDYWWFPRLGWSMHRDSLFDNELAATSFALRKAEKQRGTLDAAIRALESRWRDLQ